jgi:hypothetical protein
MLHPLRAALVVLALSVATAGWTQETATELKKELLPKIKKAQADGKDLGAAKTEYDAGDKALRDGLQEDAIQHFKKAKSLMPPG